MQNKPAQRGSGQVSIKDIGNLDKMAKDLEHLKNTPGGGKYGASVDHISDQIEKLREKTRDIDYTKGDDDNHNKRE